MEIINWIKNLFKEKEEEPKIFDVKILFCGHCHTKLWRLKPKYYGKLFEGQLIESKHFMRYNVKKQKKLECGDKLTCYNCASNQLAVQFRNGRKKYTDVFRNGN